MNDSEPDELEAAGRARLKLALQDHSDLDAAVQALSAAPVPDMMVIGRLKRKKLLLKDEIAWLESRLIPDSIA